MDLSALGMIAAPIVGGAVNSLMGNRAAERSKDAANANYQNAINYLTGISNTPVKGFYGEGGSTGDSAYDMAVRAVALGQLGQQLDAARLNMARGNLTDAQARAKAYAKEVALRKAVNDGAVNAAAKATLRLPGGTSNMDSVYSAGLRNGVRGNNAAYANAMNLIANNDANYQMNPAYMDALNQVQLGNQRQNQYAGNIAQMMAGMPTGTGFSTLEGGLAGAFGGLSKGIANYLQYTKKDNQSANKEAGIIGIGDD